MSILSDTEGVDFAPYVSRLLTTIRHNWELPESVGTGKFKVVFITFQIAPDGSIWASDPVLERTSGDQAYDNAAMVAVRASSPFEALPPEFHGPHLELRIAFMYNHNILIEFKSLMVLKLAKDEPLKAVVLYTVNGEQGPNLAWVRQKAAGSFDNVGVSDFYVERWLGYKGPFNDDRFKECAVRYVLGWIGPSGREVPFTGDPPHLVNISFDYPSPLDSCEMNMDRTP